MSKSSGGGLFGASRTGTVAIVEAPVSRAFARNARIVFYILAPTVWLLVGLALRHVMAPVAAIGIGLAAGLVVGLLVGAVVAVWPVLRALWHWSAEITLSAVLVGAWVGLSEWMPGPLALLTLTALVAGPWGVPRWRPRLAAFCWCAIVRHRLRASFADFLRTPGRTRAGRLPLILLARPTPAGERVWVWLRPGLELKDLEDRGGKLAVACWADTVVTARASTSHAALIRVDITRRDPLSARVASPLLALLPAGRWQKRSSVPAATVVAPAGLDLPDIPEPDLEPAPPRQPRERAARRLAAVPAGDDDAFI